MGVSTSSTGGLATARSGSTPDRHAATIDTLAMRLLVRAPDELADINQLLDYQDASRGSLGWMRHRDDRHWHEIREIVSGGVSTWCSGSASYSSIRESFDIEAKPLAADRCSVCEGARRVRLGLAEIVEVTP
jgi:hypothetical protein